MTCFELDDILSDIYFCNFSLFQSLPDTWAIDQLFPVMPIQRLDEKTDPPRGARRHHLRLRRRAWMRFICEEGVSSARSTCTSWTADPYYLGVFLVGAYQETLGDLHNLFGDAHAVHISTARTASGLIEEVVKGDTAGEVLSYVQYDAGGLRVLHASRLRARRADAEQMSVNDSKAR